MKGTAEGSTSRGSSRSAAATSEPRSTSPSIPGTNPTGAAAGRHTTTTTAATTRLPSFVVTSSNDAGFAKSSVATSRPVGLTGSATTTTGGSTMTLNPEAREFRVSPGFAGSLFAMPSAVTTPPGPPQPQLQRWFPTAAMDFAARPPGSVSASGSASASRGTPQGASSPPPTLSGLSSTCISPTASAAAAAAAAAASAAGSADTDVLETSQLIALTEAYMHELYDRKCARESLHMVSVFHLHPRTTDKQLSRIFFPTGATTAEVLMPGSMPAPLARTFSAVRQRAGVVFFGRKDFAMVGVEKVHDFVPHGQHQPLVVRYCGPDRKPTPLSGSPLPARSQSSGDYNGGNTAAAGAAAGRGDVESLAARITSTTGNTTAATVNAAPARHRDAPNPRDLFPCAILSGIEAIASAGAATPTGQAPPHAGSTTAAGAEGGSGNGANTASSAATYDAIDQYFFQKYAGEQVYLVGVHNLAYGTTTKSLFKMFYPMGALDSELLPRPVSVEGKLRCSGVAVFGSRGMAVEAAEKMNDFVPHGQRRPIVARFLERGSTGSGSPAVTSAADASLPATIAATSATAAAAGSGGVASASTPRGARASPASLAGQSSAPSTAAALLDAIERQLRGKSVSDAQLAADMAALVLCADSGEAEAKQLAALLRDVLLSMRGHSTILASPLSGAFRTLHNTLGIRVRTAPPTPADAAPSAVKGVQFLQQVGRTLMMLVADTEAAHQTRLVAAVQCAYLYQYTYLPKTPLCFAMTLFSNCARELREAKEFLCRAPDVPSSVAEEQQHRPWITLMDTLQEMVSVWRTLDPLTYAQDPARVEYERFIIEFRGLDVSSSATAGSVSPLVPHVSIPAADGKSHQQQRSGGACTPREEGLDAPADAVAAAAGSRAPGGTSSANASAKKSLLVTPSARPTPRRVVSKSYSTTTTATNTGGDWKAKQATPIMGQHLGGNLHGIGAGGGGGGSGSLVPPQVMLASPASDFTQGASELSSESASAGTALNSALRSLGLTPQHPPPMRVSGFARFPVAAAPTAPATPPPAATIGSQPVLPPPLAASLAAALLPAAITPTASAASGGLAVSSTSAATLTVLTSGVGGGAGAERSDATMTECTVYITKLPSSLTAGQVRLLLLRFGDFRKVRLYNDDKETTRVGSAEALAAHQLKFHQLCFGFVEFAEAGSARAMVEFFRNEVHTPAAFNFLQTLEAHDVDDAEVQQLRNTRTSQARSPIHDQHPLDATRGQRCLFGLLQPSHAVDTYIDAMTPQVVADGAQLLGDSDAAGMVRTASQPHDALERMPAHPGVFSAASSASSATAAAAAAFRALADAGAGARGEPRATDDAFNADDEDDGTATFALAALQSVGAVHFPPSFPYHDVFAAGSSGNGNAGVGEDVPPVRAGAGAEDGLMGQVEVGLRAEDLDLYGDTAPVLVEDEDDEDDLHDYRVQQILQLLR